MARRLHERLVELTKTAFPKAVRRRLLNEEEFKTLVVECIVNCRPLTYVVFAIEKILRIVDFAIIASREPSSENDKDLVYTVDSRGKLLGSGRQRPAA
uniref:Histone domain-containing protein n=1 Tax=Ascaris lumbricoides TaxID=6252 RepID=A0A0M3IG73_ASCLU